MDWSEAAPPEQTEQQVFLDIYPEEEPEQYGAAKDQREPSRSLVTFVFIQQPAQVKEWKRYRIVDKGNREITQEHR